MPSLGKIDRQEPSRACSEDTRIPLNLAVEELSSQPYSKKSGHRGGDVLTQHVRKIQTSEALTNNVLEGKLNV